MDTPKGTPCNPIIVPTSNKYARLENYELIKHLNNGVSSIVKLGRDIRDNSEHIIKIIKPEFVEKYLNDENKIKRFINSSFYGEHSNIIRREEILPKAKYVKKNGKTKEVYAIILENAPGGDLFECVKVTGNLKEEIARTYFQQLIDTIDFLHSKGIAHRDLKPDNLLLGSDFKLKLSDFSLSSFIIKENNGNQKAEIHLCPRQYSAPEIIEGTVSNPFALDIYTCGIILYIMVLGSPPYDTTSDNRYKYIMKHQFDNFWKSAERIVKLSSEFKDLVSSMICYDPAQRLSISEVKAHTWYSGSIFSVDQLREEYKAKEEQFIEYRKAKEQEITESKKIAKQQQLSLLNQSTLNPIGKQAFHAYHPISVKFRSILDGLTEKIEHQNSTSKDIKREYRDFVYTRYRGLNEIVFNVDPECLFKLVLLLVQTKFNSYKVHDQKFKVKGRIISNSGFSGELAIEVTRIDDECSCIIFTKLSGSLSQYYKFIEDEAKIYVEDILTKNSEDV